MLASSELVLRDLQPGTRYQVSVRVKLDGVSYSGYWSAWAAPAFTETLPAGQVLHTRTGVQESHRWGRFVSTCSNSVLTVF